MLEKKSDKFDNLAKKCKICVTIPFSYVYIGKCGLTKRHLIHFNKTNYNEEKRIADG